jgi:ATP-dependent Lon protease
MFVCTSNYLERIPPALRDRMDIIRISSYTREEKFEIAKQHLIPKQMGKNGLKDSQFSISDEALRKMIVSYTAEPGVRNLERVIARACRKAVMNIQEKKSSSTHITPDILEDVLGAGIIHRDAIPEEDTVGLINGLAYTQVGGCILPIQVTMRDAGQMQIKGTGLLGETMRESLNYVAEAVYKLAGPLGLDKKKLGKTMFHVHAPAAAIPKDGPSAGMAIATALISTLADIKIRRDVAMTGEIDVFGNILPIGGLKEKIEGAADAGARLVLIPHGNLSDLEQVPEAIRSRVEIRTVKRLEETLKLALTEEIKPAATTDNVIAFTSAASCDNDCGCTHNKPDTKKNATGGPAPG